MMLFSWLGIQFYALMVLSGGLPVPLGIPPLPEDPMLARIAPDEPLYYTTWAGMAEADPESTNHVERLIAEPEVRGFVSEAVPRLKQGLIQVAHLNGIAEMALAAEVVPAMGHILVTRPTAIFVTDFSADLRRPDIRGAVVINLGESEDDLKELLDKIQNQLLQQLATKVTIAETEFERFQLHPQAPMLTWGIKDNYFIFAVGDTVVEELLQRGKTPPPDWLMAAQQRVSVERRATLTYANLQGILEKTMPAPRDPQTSALIQAIGLSQVRSYVCVTGLEGSRFVSRTSVETVGPLTGLWSAAEAGPLNAENMRRIPADATIACAVRLDSGRLLDALLRFSRQMDPGTTEQFEAGLNMMQARFGFDLRKDLLASLGDEGTIYASPSEGGFVTGWVASVTIRDRGKLQEIHNVLLLDLGILAEQNPRMPRVKTVKLDDDTVQTLVVPEIGFPFAPTWCLTDDQFVISLFPQALRAHLRHREDNDSLRDMPVVADAFDSEDAPFLMGYRDTRAIFRILYPMLQIGAQSLLGELQREGIDLDLTLLPSASSISPHLKPGLITATKTDSGFLIETSQSIPGGMLGVTAPVFVAITLPAIESARRAAALAEAQNNLRQIALALHNYHETYRGFPAAYNVDDAGEPLLSWRVHVLPFIEQQELYQRFRFDEPWNSEHNRSLIKLMPEIYKAPGSNSDNGKTNYLGLRGEQGVIIPPAGDETSKVHPVGVQLGDIRDGASNTIAIVEASDELAVIWTKPDDFEPDRENPISGLIGVRPGIFFAAMCDGSIRQYAEDLDKAILRALFSRNGGEPIPNF